MEHNQSKNRKLLTPLMLASAAVMLSSPVMAYDHNDQLNISNDGVKINKHLIQNKTATSTGVATLFRTRIS
jgi:hypothetical protein